MRELLLGDWKTKAWAFGLALLLWYHASQQVLDTAELAVPLELLYSQDDLHVVVKSPADQIVEVGVRGRRTLVEALRGERLGVRVRVAPPDEPVGAVRVELTAKMVRGLPRDVQVTGFDPATVKLELSQISTRTLPVILPSPEALGPPAPGHQVASVEGYPPKVQVRGPVSVLEKAEKEGRGLPIKPITITPRETGWVSRPNWPLVEQLDGEQVWPLSSVTVYILILAKTEKRSMEVPVLIAKPADYPYEAELDAGSKRVEVIVEGPAELVGELSEDAVEVLASVRALGPSETQQYATVNVALPKGITLVGEPPQVKVNVRERPLTPPVSP